MLTLGIFAVFIALAISIAVFGTFAVERGRQARMTQLVNSLGGGAGPDVATAPAADRLLRPLWTLLIRLARRISGADSGARLQRRLDLAGNPPQWTVDRILACKAVGLLAGGVLGALIGHRAIVLAFLLGSVGAAAGFFCRTRCSTTAGSSGRRPSGIGWPTRWTCWSSASRRVWVSMPPLLMSQEVLPARSRGNSHGCCRKCISARVAWTP